MSRDIDRPVRNPHRGRPCRYPNRQASQRSGRCPSCSFPSSTLNWSRNRWRGVKTTTCLNITTCSHGTKPIESNGAEQVLAVFSGGHRTDAPSSHGSCTLTATTGIPDDLLDHAERDFLAEMSTPDTLQRVLRDQGVSEDVLAGLAVRRHLLSLERAERWKDSEPSNPAAWRAWAEALRRAHRLPESTAVSASHHAMPR